MIRWAGFAARLRRPRSSSRPCRRSEARALRALLAGRLAFTAVEDNGRRGYRFEGPGTLDKVIEGVVGLQQSGWWPQRDSNPCFSHDHVFAISLNRFDLTTLRNMRRD